MTADGETPLADFDGLRKRHVRTRAQLAIVEAENFRHAVIRYLVAQPSRRIAPFDFGWMLRLHAEMFGEVWSWAGRIRSVHLSIGSDPGHIAEHLAQLCDDIHGREPYLPDLLEQAAENVPMVTNRSSARQCSGSIAVNENGSPNTVIASGSIVSGAG